MTDVRKLLDEATPLPWRMLIETYDPPRMFITNDPTDSQDPLVEQVTEPDAALIVHAVNHLPDYEAAVDAAQRVMDSLNPHDEYPTKITDLDALGDLYAVLRRLRGDA